VWPALQVFVLRKLLAEKVNYTTPADYSFTPAGGTQQRLDRLVAGWVTAPASCFGTAPGASRPDQP
jgi:hypothetical protein